MDANPYAPPKAAVADAPAPTGLKRRRVITMIAFVFLTLGIYYMVWFFRRRTALNQLNSPRKLQLWPLLAFTGDFVLEMGFTIAAGDETIEVAFGPAVAMLVLFVRLAVGIVMIWQCFIIKDIIEDHIAPADAGLQPMFVERVKLSGLATFFFSIFYLQYAINRHIVGRSGEDRLARSTVA
jgi:Domain of unknown function (DUF4234)